DNNLGTVDWRTSSPSIAINPVSGDPWVAYHDSTNDDLKVAIYVGSGGDGCLTEMWDCTTIDSSGDVGKLSSIAFDSTGTAWVAYRNVSNGDLKVARHVGSGGTGCVVGEWDCSSAVNSRNVEFDTMDIAIGKNDDPWIIFTDADNTAAVVAHYVGNGAGTGCGNSDWHCMQIHNDNSWHARIAVDHNGN